MIFTAYQRHIVLEIGESVNALGLAWAGKIEINLMRFIDSPPQATMHTDGQVCPVPLLRSNPNLGRCYLEIGPNAWLLGARS